MSRIWERELRRIISFAFSAAAGVADGAAPAAGCGGGGAGGAGGARHGRLPAGHHRRHLCRAAPLPQGVRRSRATRTCSVCVGDLRWELSHLARCAALGCAVAQESVRLRNVALGLLRAAREFTLQAEKLPLAMTFSDVTAAGASWLQTCLQKRFCIVLKASKRTLHKPKARPTTCIV